MKKCYPVVECKQLKRQLKTFYTRKELHQGGLVKILLYFQVHNLTKTIKETTRILSISITIPMCSSETDLMYNFFR